MGFELWLFSESDSQGVRESELELESEVRPLAQTNDVSCG